MDENTRRESLDAFARAQVRRMVDCTPLDDAGRAGVVDGIRRCYEAVGTPWHGVVVWVPSPLAGLLATKAVRCLTTPPTEREPRLLARFPAAARRLRWVAARVPVGPLCAVAVAVVAVTVAALAGPVVRAIPALGHWYGLPAVAGAYVGCFLALGFLEIVRDDWTESPGVVNSTAGAAAVSLAWWCGATVFCLTAAAVGTAIWLWLTDFDVDMAAVAGHTLPAVLASGLALGGVRLDHWQWRLWWRRRWNSKPAPEQNTPPNRLAQARAEADKQSRHRVSLHELDEVKEAVIAPIESLERQFAYAIRQQAPAARRHVPRARDAAVRAVHELVERVTGRPTRRVTVAGQLHAYDSAWSAYEYGRSEVAGLLWDPGRGQLSDRSVALVEALDQANRAGWWWAEAGFVLICERPVEIHGEWVGTDYRLHRDDGPAVRWRDGFALNVWHGTLLPADFFATEPTARAINRIRNSEVRRAAIERIGWATYVERAGWRRVATAPDPGNPPHELVLYEDPRRRDGDVRVLVMTNGSPDRSGEQRHYAELVPGSFDDPVEAAAWQYDCPVEVYRQLRRRT